MGYPTSAEGQAELYNWLRENPHRLHLGQIGLRLLAAGRREAQAADWEQPRGHQSRLVGQTDKRAELRRTLDSDEYSVAVEWAGAASLC